MEIRELGRTGIKVFTVGIGTGALGMEDVGAVYVENKPQAVNEELGAEALSIAIAGLVEVAENHQGYASSDARILVDTAALYGNRRSERVIGEVLGAAPWMKEWVLVTTKVGRTFLSNFDYSLDALVNSIDLSQQLTGIERFEVVYLHDPMGLEPAVVLKAREELEHAGVADFVGVAANDPDTGQAYVETGLFSVAVIPETTSLVNRRIEQGILQTASRFGVGLIAATVIEKGWLTDNPPQADAEIPGRTFTSDCLDHVSRIRELCRELGVPTLAAAVKWPTYRYSPAVAVSLVGVSLPEHATGLVEAAATEISAEAWFEIEKLATHFDGQRTT